MASVKQSRMMSLLFARKNLDKIKIVVPHLKLSDQGY